MDETDSGPLLGRSFLHGSLIFCWHRPGAEQGGALYHGLQDADVSVLRRLGRAPGQKRFQS